MLVFSARGSTLLRYSVDTNHPILKIVVFLGVGVEVGLLGFSKRTSISFLLVLPLASHMPSFSS